MNASDRRRDLLARFDAEMRMYPPFEPGITYDRHDGIVRARGPRSWIVWWDIDSGATAAIVGAQARAFRDERLPLEWKVYGHDGPADLTAALIEHDFAPDESETLMVCDLREPLHASTIEMPGGIVVERVENMQQLNDYVSVTGAAFAYDAAELVDELPPRLFGTEPHAAAYVAYDGAVPIAVGRIECPAQRAFASIWGGATLAEYRGRGIFHGLVALRAAHARRAGYSFLTVDARKTSRPILERLGFVALTTITGWNLQLR